MPAGNPDTGSGALLSIENAAAAELLDAEIVSIDSLTVSRGNAPVTHLGSTWEEFIATLPHAEELSATIHFDSLEHWNTSNEDMVGMITGTVGTIEITAPVQAGTTGAKFSCSGFVTAFRLTGMNFDSAMTATIAVKFTGAPTLTAEV